MFDLRLQVIIYPHNDGCFVDSTLTAYKVALLWTILCTNHHDTLTKTLTQNSSIDSHLFRRVNCQECCPRQKRRTEQKVASWNLLCSVALDASFSCNSTQTILGRRHFGIRCTYGSYSLLWLYGYVTRDRARFLVFLILNFVAVCIVFPVWSLDRAYKLYRLLQPPSYCPDCPLGILYHFGLD